MVSFWTALNVLMVTLRCALLFLVEDIAFAGFLLDIGKERGVEKKEHGVEKKVVEVVAVDDARRNGVRVMWKFELRPK